MVSAREHPRAGRDYPATWQAFEDWFRDGALSLFASAARQSHRQHFIRTLDRLTRFGFGYFDVEPSEHSDPCLTLFRTIGLPAQRLTRRWPDDMQQAHAADLAKLYRQQT